MTLSMIAKIVLWSLVAIGTVALVWATAFREPAEKQILREITWSELKEAGQLNVGEIQQRRPFGDGGTTEDRKSGRRAEGRYAAGSKRPGLHGSELRRTGFGAL